MSSYMCRRAVIIPRLQLTNLSLMDVIQRVSWLNGFLRLLSRQAVESAFWGRNVLSIFAKYWS